MLRTEEVVVAATAIGEAPRRFAEQQRELAYYNRRRLEPAIDIDSCERGEEHYFAQCEADLVARLRTNIAALADDIPSAPADFIIWFESLRETGPGQQDRLFPWLATKATRAQMHWFLTQEVAGEAGFDDLVALTQVKMPVRAKLEMARNYWDEMGRGNAKGMHGPMLSRLARYFAIQATPETTIPEALALGNLMIALACNRHFAFHSVGALGVIEMTAPTRVGFVNQGLRRLGVPAGERHYFALHATLDVRHSEAWNREVLLPLVTEDSRRARAIGEGALLRLWCGQKCFDAYRKRFKLVDGATAKRLAP